MRTEGRVFVGAEVHPAIKEKLLLLAERKGVSQAELVRDVLEAYFAFSHPDMDDMNGEDARI